MMQRNLQEIAVQKKKRTSNESGLSSPNSKNRERKRHAGGDEEGEWEDEIEDKGQLSIRRKTSQELGPQNMASEDDQGLSAYTDDSSTIRTGGHVALGNRESDQLTECPLVATIDGDIEQLSPERRKTCPRVNLTPALTDWADNPVVAPGWKSPRGLQATANHTTIAPKGNQQSAARARGREPGMLNCYYTNATSLNHAKLCELSTFLVQSEPTPNILMITETWFDNCSITNISNYTMYRRDRDGRGGGVLIYVKNCLLSADVTMRNAQTGQTDMVWCEVKTRSEWILIGCIYRPPNSELNPVLSILEEVGVLMTSGEYTGVIVAGDFNLREIHWSADGPVRDVDEEEGTLGSSFIDCLFDQFLWQNVYFLTFRWDNDTDPTSVLDLVITESPDRVHLIEPGPELGFTPRGRGHLAMT